MPEPLDINVPPVRLIVDEWPRVRLPAPMSNVPAPRVSNLVTVRSVAAITLAPAEFKLRTVMGPVKANPEVSPRSMLSATMAPVPVSDPDANVNAAPGDAISVPSTVNVDEPVNVSAPVIVTVIPGGIITMSDDIVVPGARPPQVAPASKLPDTAAV